MQGYFSLSIFLFWLLTHHLDGKVVEFENQVKVFPFYNNDRISHFDLLFKNTSTILSISNHRIIGSSVVFNNKFDCLSGSDGCSSTATALHKISKNMIEICFDRDSREHCNIYSLDGTAHMEKRSSTEHSKYFREASVEHYDGAVLVMGYHQEANYPTIELKVNGYLMKQLSLETIRTTGTWWSLTLSSNPNFQYYIFPFGTRFLGIHSQSSKRYVLAKGIQNQQFNVNSTVQACWVC